MPFISTKTTVSLSKEKEEALKARFGKAISLIGKSEHWLMLSFEDNCRMWFQGSNAEPIAFLEVKLFGKAGGDAYERMTSELTGIVSEELGVAPSQIYVKYEETAHWGYNGSNF